MIFWFILAAYGVTLCELLDTKYRSVVGNWYFWLVMSVGKSQKEKDRLVSQVSEKRERILSRIQKTETTKVVLVRGQEREVRRVPLWSKVVLTPFAFEEFARSFVHKILWMLFYFTLGVSNFLLLWLQQGYYKQGLKVWGFGQIVPMFLLALPFLNYLEIWKENQSKTP